jgi:hypothetical protein
VTVARKFLHSITLSAGSVTAASFGFLAASDLPAVLSGAVAPDADFDEADGAYVGALYVDTVAEEAYVCISPAAAAAVWKQIT